MFYFIGIVILEASGKDYLFIIVGAVYGAIILTSWARMVYKYHACTLDQYIYDGPLYLYTMLSPASMIGLPMANSSVYYVVIYASPVALLFLILLLNRNMKIF